ncbi:superinfection immunity protein [Flavobacterium sp.]|jgi:hypothetical protein|uniref:superinfection immunity protein n=1 Tax=Flavobacterium sp. TaxID=239 RepID=UPI0037BE3416
MNEYIAGLGFLTILIIILLYFLPTIIAFYRGKSNWLAIMLVNIFFGWSFIGWFVALIWAVTKDVERQSVVINNTVSSERTSNHLSSPMYHNEPINTSSNGKSLNDLYRERLSNKEPFHQPIASSNENVPLQNNTNQLDKINHLKELKALLDSGILTQEEFEKEKNKILNA